MSRGRNHHDRRASEYAKSLGWEVTLTANGHARLKCQYGCCLVIASEGNRKNGGYKNTMTRIRKCPGAKNAAAVQSVVDEFLADLPPDTTAVDAWTDIKTEAPQEPEATQPQTGEPAMARLPDYPELYELVTDLFLERPNQVIRAKDLREIFAGEDAAVLERMVKVLSALHDVTIRRVISDRSEPNSVAAQCFEKLQTKGLFYRTTPSGYVLDPNARIARRRITHNAYEVNVGSGAQAITASVKDGHPYAKRSVIVPVWTKKADRETATDTPATPEPEAAPAPAPTPEPTDTRPWRPVVTEVKPGGLEDVVVIIGRSEDGTLVLQSTTEIIITKIQTTVPR